MKLCTKGKISNKVLTRKPFEKLHAFVLNFGVGHDEMIFVCGGQLIQDMEQLGLVLHNVGVIRLIDQSVQDEKFFLIVHHFIHSSESCFGKTEFIFQHLVFGELL